MNIIEAAGSGKRFRRPGAGWVTFPLLTDLANILAEDWEVEEQYIDLTQAQIFAAIQDATAPTGMRISPVVMADIAKKLGFE